MIAGRSSNEPALRESFLGEEIHRYVCDEKFSRNFTDIDSSSSFNGYKLYFVDLYKLIEMTA